MQRQTAKFLGWTLQLWAVNEGEEYPIWDDGLSKTCAEATGLTAADQMRAIAELARTAVFDTLADGEFLELWQILMGTGDDESETIDNGD